MDLLFVSMPFHSLEVPSSAFGVLKPVVESHGHRVEECYAGLEFAEYLIAATDAAVTPRRYEQMANEFAHAVGDWIFAAALSGRPDHGMDFYPRYLAEHGVDVATALAIREHAAGFVDLLAERIVGSGCEAIACTTTFMQNVPSLALARRVKQLRPELPVLFGGGNCDGVQGAALLRNFAELDYVVSGEGEHSLPQLLEVLACDRDPATVGGLHWRDSDGRVVSNPTGALVTMNEAPLPDYDSYFRKIAASPARPQVSPKLVLEAARGCWWGQKHHCTFCGLNGTSMQFRSKSPALLLEQVEQLTSMHRCLDLVMVDNIMDNGYVRDFLPQLAERDWDLRIHWEVKSNLSSGDIDALRAAGVHQVQPGIESLSSRVLKLMRKGVTGTQNVQVLRDCEAAGLTVSWNLLFGFPGEQAADYLPVLAQLPNLIHLQPPGAVERLLLERFSPYFDNPELGFQIRRPAAFYEHIYDLPLSELHDLVYLFDAPQAGIDDELERQLRLAVARWTDGYRASSLQLVEWHDTLVVLDDRLGWPGGEYSLDPETARLYRALDKPRRASSLARDDALGYSEPKVERHLSELAERGLTFTEDGLTVAVAKLGATESWTS